MRTIGFTSTNTSRRAGKISVTALLILAGALGGCNADSFLDPSVTGRWEPTPTVMPILDRISSIEDEPAELVQTSPILPGDLLPEVDQYRLGPGDSIEIRIRDFFVIGVEEGFQKSLDQRGYFELSKLGAIRAQGKTSTELMVMIENLVREKQITDKPVVSINLLSQRKQTYSVMGAVSAPGTYFVPAPDFRLLEAIGSSGAINETLPFVYIVRQVSLSDAARGIVPEPEPVKKRGSRPTIDSRPPAGEPAKKGEDLLDLIDDMTKPPEPPKSPGTRGGEVSAAPVRSAEPPPIQLPDDRPPNVPTQIGGPSGWVYADGQWIKSGAGSWGAPGEQNAVTQRVIKVPVGPLLAGAADVNIVIRPGDVIRVPVPRGGLVYMAGQVARPGPYALPTDGKLTLIRAIDAAGGLNSIAIPEKIDIMRMVGENRQATISLNYRAIVEQNQPDIVLKADDRINVGTNFWAQPLAIIRNGFRASYGFGFILDRNFQGEVFGTDLATFR